MNVISPPSSSLAVFTVATTSPADASSSVKLFTGFISNSIASFTDSTVTVTVVVFPSVFVYVNVSIPLKLSFGIYLIVPSLLIETVPFVPCVTLATDDISPSISVSFANTSISISSSSFVTTLSATTTVSLFITFTIGSISDGFPSTIPSLGVNVNGGNSCPLLTKSAPA